MNDFSPNLNYYRPSGAFSLPGVILTLIVGVVAGIVLGCIYAFVNHHDPLLYLNILLAAGFGLALGWLVTFGVRRFEIRNPTIAVILAFLVFLVAYLVHWVAYVAVLLASFEGFSFDFAYIAETFTALLGAPDVLLELIKEINREGVWNITSNSSADGIEVKGMFLAGIWIAEALTILYYTCRQPLRQAQKPYSEQSGKWLEPQDMPLPIAHTSKDELESAIARNDYKTLSSPLPPVSENEEETASGGYAVVTLYPDAFEPCVSVRNVTVKKKRKKKTSTPRRFCRLSRFLRQSPRAS